ncbi:hypothetical protein ANN_16550 [Periplaneta americana]|uniref:Uncharacterized protein n=1 Tax=Periplaneta americana TaxID=6978 RepID=A0ABQ8SRT8_PERAM|nr:hypothetical protein ANN_16550 [Periplaneta americana]
MHFEAGRRSPRRRRADCDGQLVAPTFGLSPIMTLTTPILAVNKSVVLVLGDVRAPSCGTRGAGEGDSGAAPSSLRGGPQRLGPPDEAGARKIFGAKRDEVTGEWRKLHNTELHELYSSPDIVRNIKSRRLRWAGHVARMGESRNAYRVLVGRPEGKRPSGRPRRRWEDNIKMDLREVGYDARDWINLAQDRDQWRAYVRAAMNLRYPEDVGELMRMRVSRTLPYMPNQLTTTDRSGPVSKVCWNARLQYKFPVQDWFGLCWNAFSVLRMLTMVTDGS